MGLRVERGVVSCRPHNPTLMKLQSRENGMSANKSYGYVPMMRKWIAFTTIQNIVVGNGTVEKCWILNEDVS